MLGATVNGVYRIDDRRSVGAYASYLRADTGNASFNVERTENGLNYTVLVQ